MDSTAPASPLTPAAFVYAAVAALTLAVLPMLETPLRTYAAAHHGAVLLGRDPFEGLFWGLGLGGLLATAGHVLTRYTAWGKRLQRLLGRMIGGLHPLDAVLLAAQAASP